MKICNLRYLVMSEMVSHRLNLNFSKSWSAATGVTYQVSTEDERWTAIALHLTNSSFEETHNQIKLLNKKSDAKSAGQQWREVLAPTLLINSDNNSVKVGNSIISVDDLKDLLQEWVSFTHPFSLENEAVKACRYFMLPVTQIIFDDRFPLNEPYVDENLDFIKLRAKLYFQQHYIGEIPYMISHFGPMYDTGEHELIDWKGITSLFNQVLFEEILKQEPAAGSIESNSYSTLLVKDQEGKTINIAFCHYINNQWQINLTDLNSELKNISVSVKLKAPSPLNL